MSQSLPPDAPADSAFVTTRWTQVLIARGESPEAKIALGQLCEAYWLPVFRFVQRSGYPDEPARDLTQEFFAQLLARGGLARLEQGKGRFRSYLLGAVKHFLVDQKDRNHAAKRGGGQEPESIDNHPSQSTTVSIQIPDPSTPPPDAFFDRQWALNVIDRALKTVSAEFTAADKSNQFETLKPWLVGEAGTLSQADAGRRLGLGEGAVKVAIHRLRKRFREAVKTEVAVTLDEGESVQAELKYLLEALAQS
jgi:DNA-directed RNA polymerase specialized sigma24 family protein